MARRRTEKKAVVKIRRDAPPINYKDLEFLAKCLTPQGQILSRKRTGLDTQRQRELKKAIKRARHLALLPYIG
jgi:small subunit ribosomal protein S18